MPSSTQSWSWSQTGRFKDCILFFRDVAICHHRLPPIHLHVVIDDLCLSGASMSTPPLGSLLSFPPPTLDDAIVRPSQIGRASYRERVYVLV